MTTLRRIDGLAITTICAIHNRWVEIKNVSGQITTRDCPECPSNGSPSTKESIDV